MKTLYLHIGIHKTGSSSIQGFLSGNSELLEKENYYYPKEGSYYHPVAKSQAPLSMMLLGKELYYLRNIPLTKIKCIQDIKKDIQQSISENVVVSSEHFRGLKNLDQIIELKNIFLPIVDNIKVLVYLRRQDLAFESEWSQNIKNGAKTLSFDDYLDGEIVFAERGYDRFDYSTLLNNFAQVFGADNLIVRLFEKGQLHQGCVVLDFLMQIGVKQGNYSIERLNESPSIEHLEVIRSIVGKIESREARKAFIQLIKAIPLNFDETKYSLFSNEARMAYLSRFKDSNAMVAKSFLNRDDGVLFYEPCQNSYPVYPGLSNERMSEISEAIFSFLGYSRSIKNESE